MKNFSRMQEALNNVLKMFETGSLPEAVARTFIQAGHGRPCDSWSLGNRLLMYIAGTDDARGLKQWNQVGRKIKKGAKAFYILAPCGPLFKELPASSPVI